MRENDWDKIVEEHGPAVWATAYRLLGNYADASDCFSETFAAALEVSRRQKIQNFYGMLIKLATWRAIDQLRRRMNQSKVFTNSEVMNNKANKVANPDLQAQRNELSNQLRTALSQLPENESQAFCLRYLNEFSYEQIAQELGVNVSNAGVLLHRAKKNLREILRLEQEIDNEVVL